MNELFLYSIIFILLAGFLCGGILGSMIIRRIVQMRDMLDSYCMTEHQNREMKNYYQVSQTIELTQEERKMLLEDLPEEKLSC